MTNAKEYLIALAGGAILLLIGWALGALFIVAFG